MLLISKIYAAAQKAPEDFGYRHFKLKYLDDPVDIIVISKPGEERIAKPIFLFCQGSKPEPLIKYSDKGLYEILPFDEEIFLDDFHIVIIGKPFIPIISNVDKLSYDFLFLKDQNNRIPPRGYSDRNYLDYYVFRNNSILKQLFKYRWAKTSRLLVVGYGEGSSIAVKMASLNKKITHLIYAAGNPFGNMLRHLQVIRTAENNNQKLDKFFNSYKEIIRNSTKIEYDQFETSKAIFSFSLPQRDNILSLKIPVLIYYEKDDNVAFNDLLQIEAVREGKENIEFNCNFYRQNCKLDNKSQNKGSTASIQSTIWLKWWQETNIE